MSLPDDLRDQARRLASHEPRRPRQASLRRAVSAAYYALFHLLVTDATEAAFGASRDPLRRAMRHALARAFDHGTMMQASKALSSGNLPATCDPVRRLMVVSADLKRVAKVFADLQAARHRADYDMAEPFRRSEVSKLLEELDDAWSRWKRLCKTDEAAFFLMLLAHYRSLQGRGSN